MDEEYQKPLENYVKSILENSKNPNLTKTNLKQLCIIVTMINVKTMICNDKMHDVDNIIGVIDDVWSNTVDCNG